MWKAPYRPTSAPVSQSYNSGVCDICTITDTATVGYQPVETLTVRQTLPFEERALGVTRYYAAAQAQAQIERVIRIPATPDYVMAQDGVRIGSTVYRVSLAQMTLDVYPPSIDLTLVRYSQEAPANGMV